MSNLKTGGLRDLLEQWVATAEPAAPTGAAGSGGS
jgi:hypothetical protein